MYGSSNGLRYVKLDSRKSIYYLIGAALICAASLLLAMVNINHARLELQNSKEGAFNYIFQADRSFDRLHWSLDDYLGTQTRIEKQALWPDLQLRFDLVWSTFNVFDIYVPTSRRLDSADRLTASVKQFLSENDSLFSSDSLPQDAQLVTVEKTITDLSTELYAVGTDVFAQFNVFRDSISHRMESLYRYFWISGLLLLLTGIALVVQLFRLINRSTRLYSEAQDSESRLATVIEELRSGKREQKAKDSFLAAASHDLRQPLHALGLFVSALENKVKRPDGPVILDKIKQSTEALSSLFNSLLDISRLDAGVVEVVPRHFYCADLFRVLEEEFGEVATSRGLSFRIGPTDEVVFTDYVLLGRILRNLIDNAVVHTAEGEVVVSCRRKNETVIIVVADSGPGIPLEEQEHIFSEYYQLDNPERDRSKGLGLGLSIVRRLSELTGINVSMDSKPGHGTRIELKIPAGEQKRVETVRHRHASIKVKDFQGASVLVIDDEREVRDAMQLMLKQVNCSIVSVESAEDARKLVVERGLKPALIIADYRLREGKTGDAAIALIRDEFNEDIPALIITGDTSPERVREVSESGMMLMHKPVRPAELVSVVESFLVDSAISSDIAS